MWEQVKQAVVDGARVVCGSVRVGEMNPKNIRWNDVVKVSVERKEAAWKEVLGVMYAASKDRCIEVYKEEKRRLKGVFIRAKRR